MTPQVANRTKQNLSFTNILLVGASAAFQNPYSKANPTGVINMGTAENKLTADLMVSKLNQQGTFSVKEFDLLYGSFQGSTELRREIAGLFNRKVNVVRKLSEGNVGVTNGAGSAVCCLSQVLADAGDSILIPSPVYGAFYGDLKASGQVIPVFVPGRDGIPTVAQLENAFQETEAKGSRVKAILITNPGNPTGQILSKPKLKSWIEWAHEKNIHVIVDEVYALSVWAHPDDPTCTEGSEPNPDVTSVFESVLSFDDLPDINAVHFVWSFSKDFGMSGMRAAAILSYNPEVMKGYSELCYFYGISRVIDNGLVKMLSDHAYVDNYLVVNKTRLRDHYTKISAMLTSKGIKHLRPAAGIFIWMDLSKYTTRLSEKLHDPSKSGAMHLFDRFLANKIYITPEEAFFSQGYGMYRIIFTHPWDVVEVAMKRIFEVLEEC
ncbi:hypothetical protein HDU76_006249 [Blyttiomyces sp. JEL0837]|nr:hypothetical protein HDU76_006249 [Blyttiomyces sp. JEL0837]